MRTPHAKSVAAYHRVKRQGFLDGEEFGDWLETEAEIENLLEPRRGNVPKTGAKLGFQQKLEAQLREWDAKLEELKAKAPDARAEVCAEFDVQLEALEGTRALAQEKLQELRRHGDWAWEDLKDSAEKTWSELRQAIERSASCFE